MSIWSRKSIDVLVADAERTPSDTPCLRRTLGTWNLTSIGIGSTIGAGIFVLTGTAAADYAGPAVAISFVLAAIACLCAALCYAELASMIPVAGSAYTYAYATMGELVAWVIGWCLVLEYLISVSTIAVGWSGYFTAFLSENGVHIPAALAQAPLTKDGDGNWILHAGINLPAVAVVLALTAALSTGIRESAFVNNVMVVVKLVVILLVIGFGAAYVDTGNWQPFVPENTGQSGQFGWSGVLRAAGLVFFAYIGFDTVSTSAQEARDPRRTVPLGLIFTLVICTVLYIAMSLVMTGIAPYTSLSVPHPMFVAVDRVGPALAWLKPVVTLGAIVGLASAILVTLYGQIRIFYSMSRDGMLWPLFSRLHPRHCVPVSGTWVCGILAALIGGVFPIDILGELVSIGTLLAFAMVCAGVIVLRKTKPDMPRVFRVPLGIPVAIFGVLTCVALMLTLPWETWLRLIVWMAIGFAIYFGYGYKHSQLRATDTPPGQDPRTA
jgi:basic amino acid/polyamine antiporter, APA family